MSGSVIDSHRAGTGIRYKTSTGLPIPAELTELQERARVFATRGLRVHDLTNLNSLSSRLRWTVISYRIETVHSTADPGVPKNFMAPAVGLEPIAEAGLSTLRFYLPLWLFDTTAYSHVLRDPHVAHDFHFRPNHPSRPAQDHVLRAEVSSDRVPDDHSNGF
jgi:hypothetical protein